MTTDNTPASTDGKRSASVLCALLLALVLTWLVAPGTAAAQSLFTTETPAIPDASDGGVSYELGLRFQAAQAGVITAIRHYRSPSEAGAHVGRIWSATGQVLTQVTFQNESGSGWQEQSLPTPLPIEANTAYVVSVNINSNFPISWDVFDTPVVNGDLTGVADGNNGVFAPPGIFPTSSYRNSNYFRDVVFAVGGARTLSVASGDNQTGTAGAALAQPLVVVLTDGGGNPVAGETVSFTVTGGSGSVSSSTVETNAAGQASTLLTLGPGVGTNTVEASAPLAGTVSFTATATAGAAASLGVVSGDGQTGTVGQALPNPLVVEVRDANDNPVSGTTVTFAATGGGGAISPTSASTNANGRASTALTLGTAPGTNTVSASVSGAGSVSFTASGVLDPGSAESIEIVSGDGQSAAAGTALEPFVVLVRDGNSNPFPGVQVSFALTSGSGALSATSAVTDGSGQGSTVLTLPATPQSTTVRATSSAGSVDFTATATQGAPAALVLTPANVNGAIGAPVAYQAEIEDQFGNRVVNAGGTVSFSATGISGTFSPAANVAPANGLAAVDFTPSGSGNGTITAAYASVPDATASIQVTSSPVSLSLTPASATVPVNTGVTYQATILDALGDPVTSATNSVTFAVSGVGGSFSPAQTVAASNGVATVEFTPSSTGTATVTATSAGLTGGQGVLMVEQQGPQRLFTDQSPDIADATDGGVSYELGMRFRAAQDGSITAIRHYRSPSDTGPHVGRIWSGTGQLLTQITFQGETASGWQEQDLATPLPIQADTDYVVSVNINSNFPIAYDVFNTPVVNGDLTGVANGNNGVFGASGTFPTSSYRNSNYFRDVVFVAGGVPTLNIVSGNNQSGIVGETLSEDFVVRLTTDGTTPSSGETVTFAVTGGGGTVSPTTATTDANGRAGTSLTLGPNPGTNSVSASAPTAGSVDFVAMATAGGGSQLSVTIVSGDGQTGDVGQPLASPLMVEVRDGNGDLVAGEAVTFNVTAGGGSVSPVAANTNANGRASTSLTLGAQPGLNSVVASVTGGSSVDFTATGEEAAVGPPASIVLTPATANANVGTSIGFQVRVEDAAGNLVTTASDPVTFAVSGISGTFSPGSSVAPVSGIAQVSFTGTTTGTGTVTASYPGLLDATSNVTINADPGTNPITIENALPGTEFWREVLYRYEDQAIAGYASSTSVNRGGTLPIRVSVEPAAPYRIEVYRLGYYGGIGARLMTTIGPLNGVTQPDCQVTDPQTRLVECNWANSYTLDIGSNWTTGLYIAALRLQSNNRTFPLFFTVRDDASTADILFQSSVTTHLAYANYGTPTERYSLYGFNSTGGQAAFKVSFDKPSTELHQWDNIMRWEYNAVRWLESQGYDVAYVTNIDVHTNPSKLQDHRVFLSVGHDEYWSEEMRDGVELALANGTNLGFFSANTAYWRVRFEPSSSGEPNRVMVCYKEPLANDPIAPTYLWRGPENNRPENALMGVMFTGYNLSLYGGFDWVVTNTSDPYFDSTGLQSGDSLGPLVGFEWDAIVNNGFTPNNLVVLAESPVTPEGTAPGLPPGTDTTVSHAVRYSLPGGGTVFSSGTFQLPWGLDSDEVTNPRVDARAQQFVVNILANMGALPSTPSSNIVVP